MIYNEVIMCKIFFSFIVFLIFVSCKPENISGTNIQNTIWLDVRDSTNTSIFLDSTFDTSDIGIWWKINDEYVSQTSGRDYKDWCIDYVQTQFPELIKLCVCPADYGNPTETLIKFGDYATDTVRVEFRIVNKSQLISNLTYNGNYFTTDNYITIWK